MYCDFCDGGGQRFYYINGQTYSEKCSHCKGSGYEANNHWGSYDEDWIEHQEEWSYE